MSEKIYFLSPLLSVLLSSNALYLLDQAKAGNLLTPKQEQSKGEGDNIYFFPENLEEHHIKVTVFIQEPQNGLG